jgi:hypothetical protein
MISSRQAASMILSPTRQRLALSRHHACHQIVIGRQICYANLTCELKKDTTQFENRPKKEDLVFGTTMSDHMLMVQWEKETGWGSPKIVPYGDLQLSPAASSLHYGESLYMCQPRRLGLGYCFVVLHHTHAV